MVDALKVKSDGSFALKGTGSFSVKGGDPAYIIPGLEQSHWLVNSQTVSLNGSGLITSVSDYSGVQALTPWNGAPGPIYQATGWQSGGKTIPCMRINTITANNMHMQANAWADKTSGYGGAWTIACLVQIDVAAIYPGNPKFGCFCFDTSTADAPYHEGPHVWYNAQSQYRTQRTLPDRGAASGYQKEKSNRSWSPASAGSSPGNKQMWFYEWSGNSRSDYEGQSQFYVNGVSQTSSDVAELGNYRSAASWDRFLIGASHDDIRSVLNLAEFHIWKGALTDSQRAAVTTDLMTRGGL